MDGRDPDLPPPPPPPAEWSIPPPAEWPGTLPFLFRAPVILTGDETWDTFFHHLSWFAVLVSLTMITSAFVTAIKRYRQRNPHATLARGLWHFLVLALCALWITSGLRYEHKRVGWLVDHGLLDLEEARRDVVLGPKTLGDRQLNEVDEASRGKIEKLYEYWKDIANQGSKKLYRKPYEEGVNLEREKPAFARYREKLWRQATQKVREQEGRLPYLRPWVWPAMLRSSWDYFELLVCTPASFFWTTQWFAGFVAWLLYLVIEYERRGAEEGVVVAFACLGGLVGLAFAQCLFFALILLAPARVGGKVSVPRTWTAVFIMAAQTFATSCSGVMTWNKKVLREYVSSLPPEPSSALVEPTVVHGSRAAAMLSGPALLQWLMVSSCIKHITTCIC